MPVVQDNKETFKEAIVKTIAFFDMFDYPLNEREIWRLVMWPDQSPGYRQLAAYLQSPELNSLIEFKNGFYFLNGREETIKTRLARYNYFGRKFRRMLLMIKIYRFIPWIKMIAICNLIGGQNLKNDSDIDLFIISQAKRIWLTRFCCAGLAKLFGLRPRLGRKRDKLCLNFYISEDSLDLSNLMLNHDLSAPDIYFVYWLAGLVPIYDQGDTYLKLMAGNKWLKEILSNWQPGKIAAKSRQSQAAAWFYRDIIDLLVGGLEPTVKKLQLKLMPQKLKELINRDTRVVANDQVLKLHSQDRREEFRRRWLKKIEGISRGEPR